MHILVCDDDAVFAAQMDEYISEWFRAREIQVQSTVCTSGEQLLATPELERYQLAFLDVDLKTTDGIALGRRLRQVAPDIVLVCTSRRIWNLPRRATRSMPTAICSSGILPLSCPAVWRISLPA
ncbi:MAG: response regulator [Faecalibacterium prausnitzii]